MYKSNFERLQAQALAEIGVFQSMGLDDLLQDGLASHTALVSRLNKMFINHLKTSWVPRTMRKLNVESQKIDFENAKLGMPAAHEGACPDVRERIIQVVTNHVYYDVRAPASDDGGDD